MELSSQAKDKPAVRIRDDFWDFYMNLVRDTVIPYQWDALNDRIADASPSYAIQNFRIAAGLAEGEFGGMIFQDSDVAKWLEAVGYSLASHPDPGLEQTADEVIDLIAAAQREDGYLNTYFTLKEPGKEWTNLQEAHELYCAGHMMEAAVAYYEGTGKRKLLEVMCRFADYIDSVFGPGPGQIRGYDGHQEIELALVKLYRVTGEERYLRLSCFFIDARGEQPSFFTEEWEKRGRFSYWAQKKTAASDLSYWQAHEPVRLQTAAVGHAVRAVYMYTAMADLARLAGDGPLLEACRRLWHNTTARQMYITGGIGSTHHGEAFSFDYDLPNDTVYAETCASIGLIFFANRMLLLEPRSEYADVLERALYNNVIGSMSRDGKHYFYVNPLEVWPEASQKNPGRHHVKAVRQKWFGCSCCPPNVARLLASLNDYIYTVSEQTNTVYTHLFIGSEAQLDLACGTVKLTQESRLPWEGTVRFKVFPPAAASEFTLALRIPDWCNGEAALSINGSAVTYEMQHGYAAVTRNWAEGDEVEWKLGLEARLIGAKPEIRANAGKAAIQRGPIVYCLEQADNGSPLTAVTIARDAELDARYEAELLGGAVVLESKGQAEDGAAWEDAPYRPLDSLPQVKNVRLTAVPYYLWGNRGQGEMTVWIRTTEGQG
ncbi:glycoside hydrolase family 127 protein [Paenibacillus nasutitermitis]|uniref:Glycoside hydrolase family 127 protein n=1 Tax=Paenibacillus nasutitermitis TaxID=1652958 RepID=A0A916ZEY2_9BACL|nr:beta-L-arabinofuranosidase domain-containing protein [Paenibacillus nasutitermitis]GGD93033.1 hypothetical protein GCM10010911_59510 [Paenibacillus nasutitermitis]